MPQPAVAPIIPNLSLQTEATAGSSAVIFTATDRKIIQERAGEINRNRSFLEIFSQKPLTPKVENEETNIKEEKNIKELEGRLKEHRRMLKYAPLYHPRDEYVEIAEAEIEEPQPVALEITTPPSPSPTASQEKVDLASKKIEQQTIAMAKELNLNPAEIFDKFLGEQKELHSLISRIKELHLKRLLVSDPKEFKKLSELIRKETLASARPEAKEWVEEQLEKLTRSAWEYKQKLSQSLKEFQAAYASAG